MGNNYLHKALFFLFSFILISLIVLPTVSAAVNAKYEKWLTPSFFRGHNVINEVPKTLQDFIDFRNYGGNFFSINTRGFFREDAPYGINDTNVAGTDMLVNFCRLAGLYYIIAVRSGPGAYDTYFESIGLTPESRIWNTGNTIEQQKYADMLKMIIQRYNNDTLFVGITLVVEPRPKVRLIQANTSKVYKLNLERTYDIHMDNVYSFWVGQIRGIDNEIPILFENFAYSTPELFPPYEIDDAFIVYSAHNYQPGDYTRAQAPFTAKYPGVYPNITFLSQQRYDSTFLANVVYGRVREFQQSVNKPIFLGEFGMMLPQIGGPDYIKDNLGTVKNFGWHFAVWDWRNFSTWNIENFQGDNHEHWKAVLKQFHAPPVPVLLLPENHALIETTNPLFKWDTLTSYTTFDLQLLDSLGRVIDNIEDITIARLLYTGTLLEPGKTYGWKVRSKNPGGTDENKSAWSEIWTFTLDDFLGITNNGNIPDKFALYQNYPNPFNPVTIIKYDIPKSSNVNIRVYDVTGRLVKELLNEYKSAGAYYFEFDALSLASGVYFYEITAGSFTDAKKLVIIK